MNILELLKENPDLAGRLEIRVTASDLKEFAETVINGRPEPIPQKEERYLTAAEFSKILGISLVTLWNWDKRGITKPLKFGNQKRYRLSDIEEIAEK